MISPVSIVYSEVNKLVHFLSVATDSVCLYDQYFGTHWYPLVLSLYLELSLKIFSEPTLMAILLVLYFPLLPEPDKRI